MNTKNTHTADAALEKSDVALREEAMLAFWAEHDVFNTSLRTPAGSEPVGDFVFYDGPPFATGLPHYGHILASTIKDAIPRFWTMNGYHVRRQWGWDCHGLPLENLIEKKLGLATKKDIEDYGIQKFNEAARDTVMEYADDWAQIIPRMGRWADMDNDYKTMDSSYTESVWWVFSELHKKGLVYEGFKSMHLCPRCGTTLSNFEVNQGYKDIKDIAITVKLPLLDEAGAVTDTSLLVWTTTPWTMPGNLAAAVHNEHEYAKVKVTTEEGEDFVILAKERLAQLGDVEHEVVETMKGADLVGRRYQPPFTQLKDQDIEGAENAWQILHADYVELGEEGTGAVHLAPAYGEDDMNLAKEHGVPIYHHVAESGHFKDFVTEFAGQLVKPKDDDDAGVSHLDADIEVVKALKANGKLFKKENITHSYPHCWRCDTPLLNYATTSWFVEVTKIKDQLVAENQKVSWVPEHVGTNRFGKWLEGARDWAVSRQRYWGAPLPIWRNPETEEIKVFGSLAELSEHTKKSGNTYLAMRHGEAQSNLDGKVSANKDNNDQLTEEGAKQVAGALDELPEQIDMIFHSGFMRTKATAEAVAAAHPEAELIEDDRIRELDIADSFEGKTWADYNASFPTWEDRYTTRLEGSENRRDAQVRMGQFIYDLEQTYAGKTILIVSHAGPIFALECAVQGLNPAQAKEYFDQDIYFKNAEVRNLHFTPLPHNDNFELDFHRPYIDDVELVEGETKLKRVPDVFDCWFESGSMPYASQAFPRSQSSLDSDHVVTVPDSTSPHDPACATTDLIEKSKTGEMVFPPRFPAQFIAEGLDQTRGWFYSLIVLGTALFGKSPFENVIVNGLALAEDGKKMSKSLQNYPDPMDVANVHGADAMRFYLLSSPIVRGEDLNFSEAGVQELQRKNIGRLHNVLAMYEQYAGAAAANDSDHVLDTWVLERLKQLVADVTAGYKAYELDKATRPITDFIDDLSVWYLRRSRDRLKGDDIADKDKAVATLRYVLGELAKVMAPVMPFYAEYLWQQVRAADAAVSVHLTKWPEVASVNADVLTAMSAARDVVTKALEIRAKEQVKVRQPLSLVTGPELGAAYHAIVTDEVNVKAYEVGESVTLDLTITPELQAEGEARELIRSLQGMRKVMGLNPDDRVALRVQTDVSGEALFTQFKADITGTAGIETVSFTETEGEEMKAGEHTFVVAMQVV